MWIRMAIMISKSAILPVWFALQFRELEDSSVVATRIGKSIRYVVAAAEYLKGRKYRGHGIGLLPSTYCDEALASGALIRLLPKWASPQIPVFAVYSNRKFLPLRLNVFLKALAAWKSPLWIKK
jgi:DNA-binding transcriptional LysR family regulator